MDRPARSPLEALLRRLRPRLEEVLRRHAIPEPAAEGMLQECVRVLAWKWEMIRNREAWLEAVLERKCRAFVRQVAPLTVEAHE